MLKITTMDASPGAATYLTHATGCAGARDDHQREIEDAVARGDAAAYYQAASALGEAQGVWRGICVEMLGFQPGDKADDEAVHAILALQHPVTGEQLGQALSTYKTREQKLREEMRRHTDATEDEIRQLANQIKAKDKRSVAFFDLTYSADKETSIYYAALIATGDFEMAKKVLDAHNHAVVKAQEYLEANATWNRRGKHASVDGASVGRFERAQGQVELHFQHTTSRSEDPHLHTHVAVPNRTVGADGKWRAIHNRAWNPKKATAARIYESELHAEIERTTPARYVAREDGKGRTITGIPQQMVEDSSQRTRETLGEQAEAVKKFAEENGRPPTPRELRRIHRVAGLKSRDPKSGKSPRQQVQEWAERDTIDPQKLVEAVREGGRNADFWGRPGAGLDERQIVRQALDQLQASSATWQLSELEALIANLLPPAEANRSVELAAAAVAPGSEFDVVNVGRRDPVTAPQVWRHADTGESIFRDPALGPGKFVLASQLTLEQRLVAQAREHGVTPVQAEQLAEVQQRWADVGVTLNEGQQAAILGILASPQCADQVVAAAGTGKSFMAGRLVQAWQQTKGGTVYGVATSQIAANVMADEGMEAVNATRFLNATVPNENGEIALTLTSDDLVVFDEANMTDLTQLAGVLDVARAAGAKVVFQGDPKQLDAVGIGGGLEWLASENGSFELVENKRFRNEWEKDASARLREGDTTALDLYEDHGRIREGSAEDMLEQAATGYVADILAHRTSALVVATNDDAKEASAAVQRKLVEYGRVDVENPFSQKTADGNTCYVGDIIQARKNAYDEDTDDKDMITNRENLRVVGRDAQGRIVAVRESNGSTVRLRESYVAEKTVLGYAGTEHAVEGVSVDTCHTLTPGYVALTRGKESNIAYVTTQVPGDHHEQRVDTTARQVMEQHLSPEAREQVAMQQWRDEIAAERNMAQLGHLLDITSARTAMYQHTDAILGAIGPDLADRVQMEKGLTGLLESMRRADMAGHDVAAALQEAVDQRHLGGCNDLAAVLRSRLDKVVADRAAERSPQTWAERVETVADGAGTRGDFVAELAERMDARTAELGEQAAQDQPEWAEKLVGSLPEAEDEAQREEWVKRAGTIAAYREQYQVPDNVTSIGGRPHEADVMKTAAWRDAARACNRLVDELDYVHQTDEELRALVARWERCKAYAPDYVADQRGRAYEHLQQLDHALDLARAKVDLARTPEDVAAAEALVAEAYEKAARARGRVVELDEAYQARLKWEEAAEERQDAAEHAERELERRAPVEAEQPIDVHAEDEVDTEAEETVEAEAEQLGLFEITTEFEPTAEADTHVDQDVSDDAEVDAEAEIEGQFALFDAPRDWRAAVAKEQLVKDAAKVGPGLEPETERGRRRAGVTLGDLRVRARHAAEMLAKQERVRQEQAEEAQRLADEAVREDEERRAQQAREQEQQRAANDPFEQIQIDLF